MCYARALMRALRTIADRDGKTIVVVLHHVNQASVHADRMVAMKEGRIVADGPPAEIITTHILMAVFGFRAAVETLNGKPFVLHQL